MLAHVAHSSRSKRTAFKPPSHPLSPGIKHPRGAGAEGVFPYPRDVPERRTRESIGSLHMSGETESF